MSRIDALLVPAAQDKIAAAVASAEAATSGEIVVAVVPASDAYPRAELLAALSAGIPIALALTLATGPDTVWRFLPVAALCVLLSLTAVRRWPLLRRLFISSPVCREEVRQRAVQAFHEHRLYQTRDATGVLLFLSLLEHRVELLADTGIDALVAEGTWDGVVGDLTAAMRAGDYVNGVVRAVERIGEILAAHAPPRPDDTDELDNRPRVGD
ncbi:MAG: TPM domain-containing protein [Nitrospirota bacterium]|jgi:putative membrane protein